uniref:CSD domain-containing protein n=2 Tax=Clastoptera arizonana TaxID=38151 RepID=A0A1B6DUA1_9HEMI
MPSVFSSIKKSKSLEPLQNNSSSSSNVKYIKGLIEELINYSIKKSGDKPKENKKGKCKFFANGWGYITPDDGGQDVYVYQKVIAKKGFRDLIKNQEVEFHSKMSNKGEEATYVKVVRHHRRHFFCEIRCFNCGRFGNHIATNCQNSKRISK